VCEGLHKPNRYQTRHSSKLITDQGPAFMSTFFQETCKILGVHNLNTTSYHPSSNGMLERLLRTLHTGLSNFVNSANNNWDVLIPFFLMAYTATLNTNTKYSPFYFLHGRELPLFTNENLKVKFQRKIQAIANG